MSVFIRSTVLRLSCRTFPVAWAVVYPRCNGFRLLCLPVNTAVTSLFSVRYFCSSSFTGKMKEVGEYGSWRSDISVDVVTSGNCKAICELQARGDSVFWLEQQFAGGRCTIFEHKNGKRIEWTPQGISVRNTVHEYGGGSFITEKDRVYFITSTGIYLQREAQSEPELVTEASKLCRFADLHFYNGYLYGVKEVHSEKEPNEVENVLAKISADGLVHTIAAGADFYASPRVSPDGQYIAWMEWNMPYMPWDETSIVVARLDPEGSISDRVMTLSEKDSNFHGLQWGPDSQLYVICDRSGWWNVYTVDLQKGELNKNLYPSEAEIGSPPWLFGDRQYAVNEKGVLLNVAGKLVFKLHDSGPKEVELSDFQHFSHLKLSENNNAFCIASGPSRLSSVLKIDLGSGNAEAVRESRDFEEIKRFDISLPKQLSFSSGGVTVSGWFYPPHSTTAEAPKDTLPPVVLMAHGGPTSYASSSLSMKTQFFTSRGFAVFDVNYRGSTGFGTEYRNLLRTNWGVVDRDDMINGANYLIEQRLVDPKKICIMGSSAGGYLLLAALLQSKVFAAAASLYGVSDLIGLYKDTHKFERGYNEQLIAKYPEDAKTWEERSPIDKADRIDCPIAFFHGDEDPVVPLSQSITLYEAVKAKGVPTALMVFPGEGHGFRGPDAIKGSVNGVYYFFCRVLRIEPSVDSEMSIDNLPDQKES